MIRLRLRAVTVPAVMLLSGCAHHGAAFSPHAVADDGRARVYIYRPAQLSNAMLSPAVVIDGKAVFDTRSGDCTGVSLAAGMHRIVLESEQPLAGNEAVVLQLESGRITYLRVDTALKFEAGKPYTRRFGIVQVDERTARAEIAHCSDQQPATASGYLRPADTRDAAPDQADAAAKFTIDRNSDPFAPGRARE